MENEIKHIVVKTDYWLFKKINQKSDYYFVITQTEGLYNHNWFQGRENNLGSVSSVGTSLSEEIKEQLEKEFQSTMK